MADMMKVKDAAALWGLTPRRVSELCKQGKIANARKEGKAWMIPVGTPKPTDQRIRSGVYAKVVLQENLPLPIGISDYRLASTEYYYIDKTMLIKDFLDERPMVSLFTRPRRFGKTLNMDMLRTFFEKSDEDTSIYFKNKKIWACGQKYRDYQGKYPVIFVSFKDVKCETWQDTYGNIYKLLQKEFERHLELLESPALNEYDKQKIKDFLDGKADENDCMAAFATLSEMLDKHYGIAPIIIVDEYDTPIQQGYMRGFYDSVIRFMRNLFSGGLKDNKHLSYGFLTGILRVAKESIFSGLNNPKINTILENKYSQYFGFTPDEVKEMARYYKAEDKYDEICAWYDGYRFGKSEIFNPWSVINYFSNECEPRAFWQSTGNNEIIGEVLTNADESIYEKLNQLLQGKSVLTYIDPCVIYPQIKNNPSSVYSFLLVAGYLKITKVEPSFNGDFMCEVALPNKE
ncbi:MAG: AAA family ATPase, partial [Lentisphaeria bacterium]|nr:AAA family ATPase [Lentisphaeria bacterium]